MRNCNSENVTNGFKDNKNGRYTINGGKKKWRWTGDVARMDSNRLTRRITEWKPWMGKRRLGRPLIRWYHDIRKITGKTGL